MKKHDPHQPGRPGLSNDRRSFLRLAAGFGTASVGAGLLAACGGGGSDVPTSVDGREGAQTRYIGDCASKSARVADAAGNTVAWLDIINDSTNLYVAVYSADNSKCNLRDMALWVGTDKALMPQSGGTPLYADFPWQFSGSGSQIYHEFVVPLASLGLSADAMACAKTPPSVNVVGRFGTTCAIGTVDATVALCCSDTPVVLNGCETAFAQGSHVFVTDPKANPESLPTLGLTKNRWGWAINLTATGTTSHDIYAGAGLNKTSAGKKVGTLTVTYTGSQATVTYTLAAGAVMTEAHLYAGDLKPTTIAPGQYGHNESFATPASSHTFTVPLSDSNGDGVWLIAHAVVCQAS